MNRRSFFAASAGAALGAKRASTAFAATGNAVGLYSQGLGTGYPTPAIKPDIDPDWVRQRHKDLQRHARGEFERGELGMLGFDGGVANIEALKSVSANARGRLVMELHQRRQAADLQARALQELEFFVKDYARFLL